MVGQTQSIFKTISLLMGAACLTGCLTPMGPSQVDQMTSCNHADMAKIKKNLVLAGYTIVHDDAETIQTDYKQVSGSGTRRNLQKISVVKLEDSLARFKVRVREDRIEPVKGSEERTSVVIGKNEKSTATAQSKTETTNYVPTSNEVDETYYEEHAAAYQNTKREVCGL
jgi:hypothetical protein